MGAPPLPPPLHPPLTLPRPSFTDSPTHSFTHSIYSLTPSRSFDRAPIACSLESGAVKQTAIHFPTLSSVSKYFCPKPRLPTSAPKCEAWPQHRRGGSMDGRLHFEGAGTESHPGLGASTPGAGDILSSPAQWAEVPERARPLGQRQACLVKARGCRPCSYPPGRASHPPESLTLFSASPEITAVIHPWEPRPQIPASTINLLSPQATCVLDLRVPCGFPGSLGAARFHTRGAMRDPPQPGWLGLGRSCWGCWWRGHPQEATWCLREYELRTHRTPAPSPHIS